MSEIDSDGEDNDNVKDEGFCHFNEGAHATEFNINLFGYDIQIHQRPEIGDMGHGASVWDASIIFSKYVEYNSKEFSISNMSGKTILELGSGCGLAGISLMIRGADVTFTDLETVTSQLTCLNVNKIYSKLIGMGSIGYSVIKPKVTNIDWTAHVTTMKSNEILLDSYEVILLTDCIFSKALCFDLVITIRKYSNLKTEIICCHEIRDEDANNAFLDELSKYYKIKRVNYNKLHPDYQNKQVIIINAKPIRNKYNNLLNAL